MNTANLRPIALAAALAAAATAHAQQPEGAQVIFTNDKLTVIDAKGIERTVKQGDFVQPGERLVAPPGVMGQLRLPDGTLVGARPGTDLKLDTLVKALGKNIVTLNEGSVRVVNVEPPKGLKPMPVEIVTPVSKLQLTGGDGESIHMKAGNKRGVEPGTYNRLQTGVATMQNAAGGLPLKQNEGGFSGRPETAPAPIATLPQALAKLEPVTPPPMPATTKPPTDTTVGQIVNIAPLPTPRPIDTIQDPKRIIAAPLPLPPVPQPIPQPLPVLRPPPPPPISIICKTCVLIR